MLHAVTLRAAWINILLQISFLSQLFAFTVDLKYCVYQDTCKDEHFDTYKSAYLTVQDL